MKEEIRAYTWVSEEMKRFFEIHTGGSTVPNIIHDYSHEFISLAEDGVIDHFIEPVVRIEAEGNTYYMPERVFVSAEKYCIGIQ